SMNVLKDLDFDLLKIDMEFLKNFHGNMNSRKIISSVINLAEALNMRTLCEGVETEEAVEFLRQAGCGRLQGYYYGKPMVYAEIIEKIKDGTYRVSDKQEWS
ncbi:MAG: EAL domain-containing protein, partial [Clostridia bacterium]|nr:EAL domain-containing protein [Clostridia bacterium]